MTSSTTPDRERRLGLLAAGFTALLWGFLAIAMKVATREVPVLTIVWFRFAFAFALLALFVGRRDGSRLGILRRPPLLGLVAALCLTANYLGYLAGLARTTPSNAQVLIQTAPLMLALVGVVVFRERLTRKQVVGCAAALAGFTLFAWDQARGGVVAASALREGNLLILAAAVAWVGYAALQKHLSGRGLAPQDLNLLLYLVPTLTLWPLVDWSALAGLSAGMWALMGFLGANTLLAYGAIGEALKRLPAYQVSVVITLNPLITLAATVVLHASGASWAPADAVGGAGYLGAALVVTGILVVLRHRARA
ncbi:MAG: DMT family transporter [Planctomycetes bacterium]|nr:DMT family transporter [Planctomycetota bacterium]